jgi:hypothetical protein
VKDIPAHVIERIVFAKSLFYAGKAACEVDGDRFSFARGILMLHDATECLLVAVANQLGADLPQKSERFTDYFDRIHDKKPTTKILEFKRSMTLFNDLRVSIKHKGNIPTSQERGHHVGEVKELLSLLCADCLGLDFEAISLKSLILNENVRNRVAEAEDLIGKGEFKRSLEALAYAMFYLVDIKIQIDTGFLSGAYSDDWKRSIEHHLHHAVYLLQNGIDPYLYFQRFRYLTPRVIPNADWTNYELLWETYYGHEGNWTKANAQFCLNFCVESALKMQRHALDSDRLIPYGERFEKTIEALEDDVEITLFSQNDRPHPMGKQVVATLKKGQIITGEATCRLEHKDEWHVESKDLKRNTLLGLVGLGCGYVLKSKVKVERREKQPPPNLGSSS